jgi:hypothetical protein
MRYTTSPLNFSFMVPWIQLHAKIEDKKKERKLYKKKKKKERIRGEICTRIIR